ncbi:UPF0298 protein [Paenibacillus nuruki]|uniref:UPF0298 protein n=1 Tax=Paenibacillus nuruki TaxID=1886670 RepID=A0A1E3L1A5_9BACL|nr:UPF0298 protein [Paenibacillus nuruki]
MVVEDHVDAVENEQQEQVQVQQEQVLEQEEQGLALPERIGYIIWVNDVKAARNLEKYGCVHYISRRMHYVVMYLYTEKAEETLKNIRRLSYVRKVERSYRNEIKTEYTKAVPDQTQFYGI